MIISFSAVFARLAEMPPAAVGFYRLAFGGLALLVLNLLLGRIQPIHWRFSIAAPFALAGLVFSIDIYFWHQSINFIGPGLATILGNFQVFFMAGFGILLFGERPGARFLLSITLAFLGLVLLVGEDFQSLSGNYRLGVFYGIVTAISYALYMLLLKWAGSRPGAPEAPVAITIASLAGGLAMLGLTLGEGASLKIPDLERWLILLAYGLFCQALGWVLISRGITGIRASVAGLAILLQPALSFLWDILIFGRPVSLLEGCGLGIALGAIYLALGRRTKPEEGEPGESSGEDEAEDEAGPIGD